jgi:hypothetical protein
VLCQSVVAAPYGTDDHLKKAHQFVITCVSKLVVTQRYPEGIDEDGQVSIHQNIDEIKLWLD